MWKSALLQKPWANRIGAAALAVALASAAGTAPVRAEARPSPGAGQLSLSLEDAGILARRALLAGDLVLARQIAETLLRAEPQNRDALMIVAVTSPVLGLADSGFKAGKLAFRLSKPGKQRYDAARATARAAYDGGHFLQAQYWLRRAAVHAPTKADAARTARDYRISAAKSPLDLKLRFSIGHSENVNGGSSGTYATVDGVPIAGYLSGTAQALPGTVGWAQVQAAYTVSESVRHRTRLDGFVFLRHVWLSREAKDIAPLAENGDFAAQLVELSLDHMRLVGKVAPGRIGSTELSLSGTAGLQYFGGDLAERYLRVAVGLERKLSDRSLGSITLSYEPRRVGRNGQIFETRTRLEATHSMVVGRGNRLDFRLRGTITDSERRNNESYAVEASVGYQLAKPVGPVRIGAKLGATFARFPDYTFFVFDVPGGRVDRGYFGSVELTLDGYGYAGFVPTLSVTASHTDSNVSRFARDDLSVQLGLKSSF